ncbi:hypothetical protein CDV36_003505 [Fusarium kuroshium]|uniref:Protein kinase domain-containing protein n=1 Tax=Fusarium kuroshium TaxID=2010991 RepID=A0A3M2SH78_9HYPO|nr:hypothetical protein CDV36_003505 [Fusarium kuroshium]
MEIFATAVTAGDLILRFLSGCAAYSDDAEKLQAGFSWDLMIIKTVQGHFDSLRLRNADKRLSPHEQELFEITTKRLGTLLGKVQQSLNKIHRKGFLQETITRATWFARKADLEELAEELHRWTQRFNIRLLGLPPTLGINISALGNADVPPVISSNNKLRQFTQLSWQEKQALAKEMLLAHPDALIEKVAGRRDISTRPLNDGDNQLVFASRRVPQGEVPGTVAFEDRQFDMGKLAAALNCLDAAADIRLLKVEYYFYHPDSMQFLFAQIPPSQTTAMSTLEKFIALGAQAVVSLGARLRLAHKLAEAVFFLHTTGFFHKNITSSSVVIFRRKGSSGAHSSVLDNAYLMGFDLIRGAEAKTTKEGTVKAPESMATTIWDFDIFQHPDRLQGSASPMYINTYDVYSLGVVLLEVGLWEELAEAVAGLDASNPPAWAEQLSETPVSNLGPRVGERYQRLVAWCLGLDGNKIVTEAEFLEMVLDPLESMASAMS